MNTVFCFGAISHPSHNKNRKVLIMRLLKVFLGKVRNPFFLQKEGFPRIYMLLTIEHSPAHPLIHRPPNHKKRFSPLQSFVTLLASLFKQHPIFH